VWALLCVSAVWACNRDALRSGDGCTRSSECAAGLVCVEGACSSNLVGIGNPGTVPMLMEEPEMPSDGGADASPAAPEPDAAALPPAADAGTFDAGP
jgi:hypothetical protein